MAVASLLRERAAPGSEEEELGFDEAKLVRLLIGGSAVRRQRLRRLLLANLLRERHEEEEEDEFGEEEGERAGGDERMLVRLLIGSSLARRQRLRRLLFAHLLRERREEEEEEEYGEAEGEHAAGDERMLVRLLIGRGIVRRSRLRRLILAQLLREAGETRAERAAAYA